MQVRQSDNVIVFGGAMATRISWNDKLGLVATTKTAISTCSTDCPFLNVDDAGNRKAPGCYAFGGGPLAWQLKRVADVDAVQAAKDEAACIDMLKDSIPLRIHEAGDCATPETAKIVADACRRYTKRTGQPVWGYTHAWRSVPASVWEGVSMVASCETPQHVKDARSRGYTRTALVVSEFESDKSYMVEDVKVTPCPEMTRGIKCSRCRLCFSSDNVSVAFEVHGGAGSKPNALRVINNANL